MPKYTAHNKHFCVLSHLDVHVHKCRERTMNAVTSLTFGQFCTLNVDSYSWYVF